MPTFKRTLVFLALCVLLSFFIQTALITTLQAKSCDGVKNPKLIFAAAAAGAVITLLMVAIPLFIEPARLVVSQLFGPHKLLDTTPGAAPVGGAKEEVLDATQYEAQTFKEMMFGSAYWAAFAGAYGIGAGSMIASKCA